MELAEAVEIHVGHEDHLGVGRSLGTPAVVGEGEVAGREHSALSILDVHVVHTRQVAHTTGDGHIALVLDGAGLGTDAHTGVGVLCVGHKRHEEDLHTLRCQQAGEFRKLHIVADHHTNLSAVGVEGADCIAAVESPALHLVGGDMDFLVHLVSAIAADEEAHIVETTVVLDVGHGARDDVDVIADGELAEAVADLLGILSQRTYGLRLAEIVVACHERSVEIFGEEDEVTLIVRYRVYEELHLLEELVDAVVGSHLPLHHADAHGRLALHFLVALGLIVDIVPLQQAGVVLRLLVVGQIVADDAAHVEIVAQLEVQHGVVDLARAHLLDILFWSHGVGVFVVVGDTPAKHDSLEIEFLAELLAILIHASAESETTVVGMDKHLDAIEDIAVGVVGVEGLVACHLCIGMVALDHVVVYDDAQRTAYDLSVGDDHHLSFGEDRNEFLDLRMGPELIAVAIDTLKRACQLVIVLHAQRAKLYLVDLMCRFHCF